jgi:glycosyltransferase involved in cell wall biosynthesis
MQCGCPVVVSDIPAHRYMGGDAALYCDPYDRADIAKKIDQVLSGDVPNDLRERGYKNAQRFTEQALLPLWEELFESARKNKG